MDASAIHAYGNSAQLLFYLFLEFELTTRLLPLVVSSALLSPSVWAAAEKLEGFSAGLNVSYTATKFQQNHATAISGSTVYAESSQASAGGADLGLQFQYNKALGERFVLGIGGSWQPDTNLKHTAVRDGTPIKFALKESSTAFIAPGIAVSENWLIFAKLAYVNAKLQHADGSTDLEGMGVGFGARYALSDHWFLQGEVMQKKYADKLYQYNKESISGRTRNQFENATAALSVNYQF